MTVLHETHERTTVDLDQLDQQLGEYVPGWLSNLDQLNAFIEEREREIAGAKERKKRYTDLLKLAGHDPTPMKKSAARKEPKPSPESVEKLVRWLADQEEPQGYRAMAAKVGISESTANKQIGVAQQAELVRTVGYGGSTGRMKLFSVFADAIKRLDEGRVQWP